jgi:phosphate transport system substrate-binding protein
MRTLASLATLCAIGYVELAYARQNNLAFAAIKNAAGAFVAPSVESATAAAEGVAAKLHPKSDYRISIANAPGAQAYPVTSLTWLLVYQDQTDPIKGKKLVDFMRWALTSSVTVPLLSARSDSAALHASFSNSIWRTQ